VHRTFRTVAKPKLVKTFRGPHGREWRIYHASRRTYPHLFKMQDGRSCLGITYFAGPRKNRIYIDSSLKPSKIWEVSLHELVHVCLEDVGLLYVIEEPIVDEMTARLANILEQLDK